jgi:hypothetical protein
MLHDPGRAGGLQPRIMGLLQAVEPITDKEIESVLRWVKSDKTPPAAVTKQQATS